MANIAALLKRIESGTLSYEEKLSALSQVEQSLQDMRQKKQEAIQSNVMLIVDALKQMQVKVEQQLEEAKAIVPQKGPKGDRGEKGDRGLDGAPGKDGRNGIDGKDGKDGNDGISVTDAKIDFDGSLVITLSNGREINVGEVLPLDVSDKIKVIANGGGTSQTVVDTLTSLQNQINTLTGIDGVLGDMAQQNANNVAITGGAINGATIGATTPSTGKFTYLTYTSQSSAPSTPANGFTLYANNGNAMTWKGANGYLRTFDGTSNTADRVYTLPDSNGTIALTSNLGTIASQNANNVAITGGAINNTVIGGVTPAAGTFTTLIGGGGSANYGQLTGGATTKAVEFKTIGSDTNVSFAIRSQGTGAIDLAAGSSGVNISNGGTVTAVTVTSGGTNYTSAPTGTISSPTTAGGVQATFSFSMQLSLTLPTITSGGSGYTAGDVLTLSGGTLGGGGYVATLTVSTVSAGVITAITVSNYGAYTTPPTSPVSVTGGTGTGATFTPTWIVRSSSPAPTISNAGSGYVEQPTVSFSGGGGSGAAAYASVGASTQIKTLFGSSTTGLSFYTPVGEQVRIVNVGDGTRPLLINGGGAGGSAIAGLFQPTSTAQLGLSTNTGSVSFFTGGNGATEQLRVSHTASAVNYVQVTGAATGNIFGPVISSQGSDAAIPIKLSAKGGSAISFSCNNTTTQFTIENTSSSVNYLTATGGAASSAPVLKAQGTDTNIDLALTPKGTGVLAFGTYTAGIVAQTGYITIKDSGGTTRRLLVG